MAYFKRAWDVVQTELEIHLQWCQFHPAIEESKWISNAAAEPLAEKCFPGNSHNIPSRVVWAIFLIKVLTQDVLKFNNMLQIRLAIKKSTLPTNMTYL